MIIISNEGQVLSTRNGGAYQIIVFFGTIILFGCDHAQKRGEGSCLKSYAYGGPFLVKKDGWNLIVVDQKTNTEERKLPNDNTWSAVECPK